MERERRVIERRIKAAKFPATRSLDVTAIPFPDKALTTDPARSGFIDRRETVIAPGPSGTGKTRVAPGLGPGACQRGRRVRFTTDAALVHEPIAAVDDRRLRRLRKGPGAHDLLIIHGSGCAPCRRSGPGCCSRSSRKRHERHEHGSIITSTLPFDEWTGVFGSQRLTGAILDRPTHHVRILAMTGESFRPRQGRKTKS